MNFFLFHRYFLRIITIFSFFLTPLYAAVTDLGKIERDSTVIVRPVAISSNQADVKVLLEKAFNMHGSFKVCGGKEAAFVIDCQKIGSNTVQINVQSTAPKQILFSQEVTGPTLQKASLQAADLVVEKIIGIPGFFAGKLAFIGERVPNKRDAYTGDLLFQQTESLTHDGKHSLTPNWSPDGRSILYTSYFNSGAADIFKINLATRHRTPFAVYKGINMSATYNPQGNKVAMILSGKGEPALYISDASGKNPKRMTHSRSAETSPTWSPDGSQIILASDAIGRPQLFLLDLKQGATPKPKRLPITISSYCAEPSWNPVHPNLVAFTYRGPNGFQIAVYDLNTHQTRAITQDNYEAIEPCWTRDGRHLIYTQRNGYKLRLHVVDSLSGKSTALHSEKFGRTSQADYIYQ